MTGDESPTQIDRLEIALWIGIVAVISYPILLTSAVFNEWQPMLNLIEAVGPVRFAEISGFGTVMVLIALFCATKTVGLRRGETNGE